MVALTDRSADVSESDARERGELTVSLAVSLKIDKANRVLGAGGPDQTTMASVGRVAQSARHAAGYL